MSVILTEPSDKAIYQFDRFRVDTQNFTIERDGEAIPLTPRAFDVLTLLLGNHGHVVEKRELFDVIWKETFVSDNALTKVVKEIRHALADSAEDPRYIETIPKRGYRFIAEVGPVRPTPIAEAPAATVADVGFQRRPMIILALIALLCASVAWISSNGSEHSTPPATIAVLPFKPLDAESRNESLELGMAETLITRLSNVRNIVVRPIGSVRKFTEPDQDPVNAGLELQTEGVLDGSIQKSGDRVRVTVRLIDTRSGKTLWSEQFDSNFTDIFQVQDSIAERITGVLALRLSRHEQEQLAKHMTDDPEAYELYLRGQFHWHRRGPDWIKQSLNAYKQALERDPNFALAHIGVADAYIMLSGHRRISMDEAESQAVPSIRRALEIDNGLAQAHNALAELKYQYQHDWAGAEEEFRIALDLNPNIAWTRQAYGWFLMSEGRFDEASAQMEEARRLDPSSVTLTIARGRLYYYSRQFDRAIEHFRRLVALDPNDSSLYISLIDLYDLKRMDAEAFDAFLKMLALNGVPPERRESLSAAFATGGRDAVLRAVLQDLDNSAARTGRQSPLSYARLYTRLGDRENAFRWWEKVFESRDVSAIQFKIDPLNDLLRDHPKYDELLKKIGQQP